VNSLLSGVSPVMPIPASRTYFSDGQRLDSEECNLVPRSLLLKHPGKSLLSLLLSVNLLLLTIQLHVSTPPHAGTEHIERHEGVSRVATCATRVLHELLSGDIEGPTANLHLNINLKIERDSIAL